MKQEIKVSGTYRQKESRHVSANWNQICAEHAEEFPEIRQFHPGTFNILMAGEALYTPPNDCDYRCRARVRGQSVKRYVDGNHLSPRAKVVEINGKPVEAWIYRGGHNSRPVLELISRYRLAEHLSVKDGDAITVLIREFPEGTPGMPGPPPVNPGQP